MNFDKHNLSNITLKNFCIDIRLNLYTPAKLAEYQNKNDYVLFG